MCNKCVDDIDRKFHCVDCDMLTGSKEGMEYYMVKHELWEQYGVSGDGMLCVGCLEQRMGRELTPADFLDCSLNKIWMNVKSTRLMRRLGW